MSHGTENPFGPPPLTDMPAKTSGKAIASLVLGLVSFTCSLITAIPGLIFGILALIDISRSRGRLGGQGMAIAGLITSSLCLVLAPILAALILPAIVGAQRNAQAMISLTNIRMIALGALHYQTNQGGFPLAASMTDEGRLPHSWRSRLLPYLGEASVYDSIDWKRPWDDPANVQATNVPIRLFVSPFQAQPTGPVTNYFAVIGEGFLFNGREPTRVEDIRDGIGNTILFVEYVPSTTHWAEPKDLTFEEYLAYVSNSRNAPSRRGFLVAMADGSVHEILPGLDKDRWKALFTIDGKELTEHDSLRR